jgi:hypothetical protein
MAKEKPSREPVTHNDLIALFRKYKASRNNVDRNRLECKFALAINEARGMGEFAVEFLTELKNLTDLETGESICPPSLESKLGRTITQLVAATANRERKLAMQQTAEAHA